MSNKPKTKLLILSLALFSLMTTASCSQPVTEAPITTVTPTPVPTEINKTSTLDVTNMDKSIDPRTDFYNFVNGNWAKRTAIPSDQVSWGGFNIVAKSTNMDVLELLKKEMSQNNYAEGSDQRKAILMFNSQVDLASRNKLGIEPLKAYLQKINDVKDIKDLQTVFSVNNIISNPFFSVISSTDFSNSKVNVAFITPPTLALPASDYYLTQGAAFDNYRNEYLKYMTKLFVIFGDSNEVAAKNAEKVLALETKISSIQMDKVTKSDVRNLNNRMSLAQVNSATPTIDWQKYLTDIGVKKEIDNFIVVDTKYMTSINDLLKTTSIDDLKLLVRWETINAVATALSSDMEDISFDFFGKVLQGAIQQQPLEERALATVNATLGEAVGKLYVDAKFPAEAKVKAEKMISNIVVALKNRVKAVD